MPTRTVQTTAPRSTRLVTALAVAVTTALTVGLGTPGPASALGSAVRELPAGPAAHLDPGLPTVGAAAQSIIVSARGAVADVKDAVTRLGGTVTAPLPLVHGVAAVAPADKLTAIAADPAVYAVTADRQVQLSSVGNPAPSDDTPSPFLKSVGADDAWNQNINGSGIGVAVLDTGVSPVRDLRDRVFYGPDLSGEGSIVDTFGHGTVMAGIIAGNGNGGDRNKYSGVAPKANIIAVKVAGRNAAVDVSTILQAMHWIGTYRQQFNIRVLNLSWGVPSTQDPHVDPINYAVERLWQMGIVVVVAAGNGGPASGTILKPADDPMVISVGAYDDRGNKDVEQIPDWSGRGPTAAGLSKPDVIAPGRKLVATRSFGSAIERAFPTALVGANYIRGSGTSEAAAVVSGAAALLLSKRPALTPDQVKYLLRSGAKPMPSISPYLQGSGRVKLEKPLTANASPAPIQQVTAIGTGSLEASRGNWHVSAMCNGEPTVITGEQDVHCEPWSGTTWSGTTWSGANWTGATWPSNSWASAVWNGTTWTGGQWTGGSWLGTGPWTGTTWTGTTWTGTTWTSDLWAGTTWSGTTWTGTTWTGTTWTGQETGFTSAFWGDAPPFWEPLPGEPVDLLLVDDAVPTVMGGLR